jgi:hypothetical protein
MADRRLAPSGSEVAQSTLVADPDGQLERPPAEVEHQHRLRADRHRRPDPEVAEPGLGQPVQHADLGARRLRERGQHVRAVVGVADRRGRDRQAFLRAAAPGELAEVCDGVDRLRDARRGDRAVLGDHPAEVEHLTLSQDGDQQVPVEVGDEHVEGVGAEVEHGRPHGGVAHSLAPARTERSRLRSWS